MTEHETWLTALFNTHLGGLGNSLLALFGQHAADPARPWANFITMQLVVALILVVLVALLRSRLSMDRPGKLQHVMETIYEFLRGTAEENVGHGSHRYLAFFGTIFLFVLVGNLVGIIPTFEAPTMTPFVTAGCAMATFAYYNWQGLREGAGRYLAHFAGPVWWMAPLMIPIEIVSHLARPLSLTIRLFANMLAGEKVTEVFLGLTYLLVPAVFMGLHTFVSVLQAYVFALMTMIYVGGAVAHDDH